MSVAALRAIGLEAGYGPLQILFGVDLKVLDQEHVLIFGPNGAGKSTLIKALFGLVPASAGKIRLMGKDIVGQAPEQLARRGIAYVPQVANVFASMSVQENLQMGGTALNRDDRDSRIDEMFTLFPILAERRRQSAGTLSGGERQMLALARALIPEPKVLLLDEPSAGVAPRLVEEIFRLIASLRRTGVSVLMIEQNARQALAHVDRAYVLDGGRVALEGPARSLLDSDEVTSLYLGGGR